MIEKKKDTNRKRKILKGTFLNIAENRKLDKIIEKHNFETSSRAIRFLITNYNLK